MRGTRMLLSLLALSLVFACSGPASSGGKEITLPDGLKYTDDQVGTGTEAMTGKTAVVHYTGWLADGTKFDSSKDRGQPFSFPLGGGRVIKGWNEGVVGMKVGWQADADHPARAGVWRPRRRGRDSARRHTQVRVELLAVR